MDKFAINKAIAILNEEVTDPSKGLPEEVFYYISKTTPLVNVDLLIKDEKGRTLLAWRDDRFAGTGWHIPGGIVRFKETLESRVRKVAESEIGTEISFNKVPIALNQLIHPEKEFRNHFISILYSCFLPGSFVPENKGLKNKDVGFLMWHEHCPDDLIEVHAIYREYINQGNENKEFKN